jgi:NADH-quinone oxidoreductase subunit E
MAYGATFHKSSRPLTERGEPFEYTPEHRARFDEIIQRYPEDRRRSAVLPALYLVQRQQGYITANAMAYVAGLLAITPADVEDVVSYYTMFYTKPVGTFVLSVCRTLPCALNGAEQVTAAIRDVLSIKPGETDATGTFTLIEVECLGACDRAPVVMVNDAWHECLKAADVKPLLDNLRARGEAALSGCHHVRPEAARSVSPGSSREPSRDDGARPGTKD